MAKACSILGLSRRASHREDPTQCQQEPDAPVVDDLNTLVDKHPRWGFWKYFYALDGKLVHLYSGKFYFS